MMNYPEIEIRGTVTKLNVDEKKATLTIEIEGESWNEIPKLTELVGEYVDAGLARMGE